MVNHTPPFHNNRKGEARRKTGSRKKRTQQENTMVFGDNVRARWAARALPRTPTQRGRRRQREEEDKHETMHSHTLSPPFHNPQHSTTRQHTHHTHKEWTVNSGHHTPFHPHTNYHRYSTITQPCHKDTALNQQCRDREHKQRREWWDAVHTSNTPRYS